MFNQIAVLGLGLIGGSIASCALQRGVARRVIGFDPFAGNRALALNLVSELALTAEQAVKDADLVVFAVPPSQLLTLLDVCRAHLKPEALITDAASTKLAIANYALAHQLTNFVPAHPIAGSEKKLAQKRRLLGSWMGLKLYCVRCQSIHPKRFRESVSFGLVWERDCKP